jgi:hypothetical protein
VANERQRFYFGSQASPRTPVAETFTLSFNGDTTANLDFDAGVATVQAALEGLASVGSGNLLVTGTANGYQFDFQGALAGTNVPAITANSSLKQAAATVTVSTVQAGVADVPVTPSNVKTTDAVTPVYEVQNLSLGGATTGTFDLVGNGSSAQLNAVTLDASALQTALDSLYGANVVVPASLGGGNFSMTFAAAGPKADMAIDNNSTDGTPVVTETTAGVVGVHQVDTCTFDGTATAGAMTLGDLVIDYDDDTSAIAHAEATFSGIPENGEVVTTWNNTSSHTPLSAAANTLRILGQPHIATVTLTDAPTEGKFVLTVNSVETATLAYDASAGTVETAVEAAAGAGCGVTGSAGGPWTITGIEDPLTPLRKACGAQVVTITQGSADQARPLPPKKKKRGKTMHVLKVLANKQLTDATVALALSSVSGGVPTGANGAILSCSAKDVFVRRDGTAPTSSHYERRLVADSADVLELDPGPNGEAPTWADVKVLEQGATAILNIQFVVYANPPRW